MIRNSVNKLIHICLDSANIAENSNVTDNIFLNELGYGIYAYAAYIRQGVKGIIDLQEEIRVLKSKVEYRDDSIKTYMRIANDSILEELNDEQIGRIKDFINEVANESRVLED